MRRARTCFEIVLLMILLLGTISCGRLEDKLVGTCVLKIDSPKNLITEKLEFRADGTYRYETIVENLVSNYIQNQVHNGKWMIVRYENENFLEFTPNLLHYILFLKKSGTGEYYFYSRVDDKNFVKQK